MEGPVSGYSKLIGAGSIYAITPCTKAAALEAVEDLQHRPLMSVTLPPERAIAQAVDDLEPSDESLRSAHESDTDDDGDFDVDEGL